MENEQNDEQKNNEKKKKVHGHRNKKMFSPTRYFADRLAKPVVFPATARQAHFTCLYAPPQHRQPFNNRQLSQNEPNAARSLVITDGVCKSIGLFFFYITVHHQVRTTSMHIQFDFQFDSVI